MNLIGFAVIFLLYTLPLSHGAASPGSVNVGAIFTFSTINGRVAKVAMKAAMDDINSDPTVLGGRKLSISMHDSNFSGFLGIIGGMICISASFPLCIHLTVSLVFFVSHSYLMYQQVWLLFDQATLKRCFVIDCSITVHGD